MALLRNPDLRKLQGCDCGRPLVDCRVTIADAEASPLACRSKRMSPADRAMRYGFTWPICILLAVSMATYWVYVPTPYGPMPLGQVIGMIGFLLYLLVYLPAWSWWEHR